MAHLKKWLLEQAGLAAANTIPLLYGGSVNADNAVEIVHLPSVDGVLVGGASINAGIFSKIVEAASNQSALQ